jgi:hypothetical protein
VVVGLGIESEGYESEGKEVSDSGDSEDGSMSVIVGRRVKWLW